MKKVLLPLIISFFLVGTVHAAPFTDVSSSHPYEEAIDYLYDEGIVEGYADSTFKPENTINRAEFTKIVIGAIQTVDTSDKSLGSLDLSDLEDGAWYVPYIRDAVGLNMIEGYPDGTFKPADEINFAESSKIIAIAFGTPLEDDVVWFRPYVDALSEVNAIPVSIPRFSENINRGEMAEIIFRLLTEKEDLLSTSYEIMSADSSDTENWEKRLRYFAYNDINEIRAEHGKEPLIMNELLNVIAMAHSKDMSIYIGEMSHSGSLEEQSFERIKEGKIPDIDTHTFTYVPFPDNIGWSGENVGMRHISYFTNDVYWAIEDQHAWFMDEPVDEANHRTTMLSTLYPFSEVGIGIYLDEDGIVWITEDFISDYDVAPIGEAPTADGILAEELSNTDETVSRYMISVDNADDPDDGAELYYTWGASCGTFYVYDQYGDVYVETANWAGGAESPEIEWRDYDGTCSTISIWLTLADVTLEYSDYSLEFTP